MGFYFPDIKPPKDEPGAFKVIVMYVGADGKLRAECEGTHEAIPVSTHGRLIDADALKMDLTRFYDNEVTAKHLIDEQPTILEAEEGGA